MNVLRKIVVARVLAAILLLAFYPVASKVVCVSPTGHCSIEDWASPCCVPLTHAGTAFSEPTLCQGCTDYPVVQAVEVAKAQPHPLEAPHNDSPILLATVSAGQTDTIAVAPGIAPPNVREPVNSVPATSLRC